MIEWVFPIQIHGAITLEALIHPQPPARDNAKIM